MNDEQEVFVKAARVLLADSRRELLENLIHHTKPSTGLACLWLSTAKTDQLAQIANAGKELRKLGGGYVMLALMAECATRICAELLLLDGQHDKQQLDPKVVERN